MLQIPNHDNGHNRSPSNQFSSNNSNQFKNIEIKNQKTNFLYDVIMPNTLDVENIKIIRKYTNVNSPESITKKIVEMKKSKIQKKIESIVNKNSEDAQKPINTAPKATKYQKQNIKRESQFAKNDKYKKFIFEQEIPVEKMKLAHESLASSNDKENNFSPIKRISQTDHWADDFVEEEKPSPFVIEMDEKLGEMRKMEEEAFEPFKQKIKKVIDKTISTGVNGQVNTLMEKVNFYLTSISENSTKPKIKKITVDIYSRDKKIKSYCEEIEKGSFVKTEDLKKSLVNRNQNYSEMRQYRSKSSITKSRPYTAGMSARHDTLSKERTITSGIRSISSSRQNRYTKSTAEFNIRTKVSRIESEKKNMNHLLDEIESTCWESHFDNKIISNRIQKMSNEWDRDGEGVRIYENKKMKMTEETLEMIKKIRMKASQVEEVEKECLNQES